MKNLTKKQKKLLIRIIVSAVLFLAVFTVEHTAELNRYIILLLYLIPYGVAGYDVLAGSVKNIIHGKVFDEKLLMTIATIGALIVGEYPESVFVMVFYQLGELFQSIAVGKSRRSISALMDLCPDEATVIRNGEAETVFPDEVGVGEIIRVCPGEKIPLDGIVTEGESAVDMSALTGESAPADIYKGKNVSAGSINLTGTLNIQVSKEYSESTASKILELVENSSLNKSKSEKFLTVFAKYYTPAVVIGAVLLAVIPSLITGNVSEWVYRALIFLVVSCPCALVISVPLAYFSAIGKASSKGVLVKGSNYIESLAKASTFVFDKTGTLTTGSLSVSGIYPAEGITEEQLISLAASAEYYSGHPIAGSIKAYSGEAVPFEDIREFPGLGVSASDGNVTVLAGNFRFMEKNNINAVPCSENTTCIYVARNGEFVGYITFADTLKKNSAHTISELKRSGIKRVVMLTGDTEAAAGESAQKLGITEYKAGLMPQEKAEFVKKLCSERRKNESVVFVGDGINDAPVIALSDVGIAMGGIGSDAAIEAADIVIMDDKPEKCLEGIKIAKRTAIKVRQNVIFALTVKFAVLLLASFGIADMWLGVIADVGVAILAIINARS